MRVLRTAHGLLLEAARLDEQLMAAATVGSTREVMRLLEEIRRVRAQVERADVGPRCVECGDRLARGAWRAYLTVEDRGEPVEVTVFCEVCAEREFG